MVDHSSGGGGAFVVDRFDAVVVEVAEKAAVIGRPVLGARSRLAVVLVAGDGERVPPAINLSTRGRGKADVQVRRRWMCLVGGGDREVVPLVEASPTRALACEIEQLKHLRVQVTTCAKVGDTNSDVVNRAHQTRAGAAASAPTPARRMLTSRYGPPRRASCRSPSPLRVDQPQMPDRRGETQLRQVAKLKHDRVVSSLH